MPTGTVTRVAMDQKTARQAKALMAWLRKAVAVVEAEVADAKAHAMKAVTDRLLATADGRPSAVRVSRSPSYQAAVGHVLAIVEKLAGPSTRSLEGLLRDAREVFYEEAFEEWRALIPLSMVRSGGPTMVENRNVRGFPLHGMDLATELGDAARRSVAALKAVVELSARKDALDQDAEQRLETWRRQTEGRFVTLARIALSDGQMYADRMAVRNLIITDFHEAEAWET